MIIYIDDADVEVPYQTLRPLTKALQYTDTVTYCLLQYEDAFWSDRISRWELPHPYKEVNNLPNHPFWSNRNYLDYTQYLHCSRSFDLIKIVVCHAC